MSKVKNDEVNHPAHYTMGSIEVINALEDWKLEHHEAKAVAYIARAKYKRKRIVDLKKAAWYLNRKIKMLEKQKVKAIIKKRFKSA